MLTRLLTGVFGVPLAIAIITWGSPSIEIAGVIIGFIGMYEFYQVAKKKYRPIMSIGYVAAISYLLCIEWFYDHFLWFIVIFLTTLLIIMVLTYPRYTIVDIAITFFGPIYVAVLLGFTLLVRYMPNGVFYTWLIFLASWGSDTCAYFAGKLFGKHKLAPILSPKKTIEGAIGGALGAGGFAIIYVLVCRYLNFDHQPIPMWGLFLIVVVAALFSQLGDLAASGIKRYFDQKDYGTLFPGHGGVLDRFDSVLFVAPVIYGLLSIVLHLKG